MSHIYFDIPIEPLPDGQSPVKHLKELGCVTVKITPSVSVMVTTAADAQELKTRFAAAEFYLTDEPLLPPGGLDDAGDDITDALVPDDVAQPADLHMPGAAAVPPWQRHWWRAGWARNPTTFRFEPTVVPS